MAMGRGRGLLWTLAIVVLVVAAVRIALNPFAARCTRAALARLHGYRGTFDDVSVSLSRLTYTVEGLKLVPVPAPAGGSERRPFFYAKRAGIALHWRDLL